MRFFSCLCVAAFAACAAADPPAVRGPTPTTTTISSQGWNLEVVQAGADAGYTEAVHASVEEVWTVLPAAYASAGILLAVQEREARFVGNPRIVVQGRLGNEPLSNFISCGITGTSAANTYRIELSVMTHLSEASDGKTRLRTEVEAFGRDLFAGNAPVRCATTFALERRIAAFVSERFRAPAPLAEALPPLLPPVAASPPSEHLEIPDFQRAAPTPVNPVLLALGGAAGAAIGAYLGDRASRVVYDCDQHKRERHPLYVPREGPPPPGCLHTAMSLLGPTFGNTVLLPLGIHLANQRQGQYLPNLLAASGWVMAGVVVAGVTDEVRVMWFLPVPQLVTGIIMERATTRTRRN